MPRTGDASPPYLCEIGYPAPEVEKSLLVKRFPVLPDDISTKMVDFAGEVRKLFMGEGDMRNLSGAIEVTLSTRTLLQIGRAHV